MDLLLLRHGIAEDRWDDDFGRRLTEEGQAKCERAGRGLAALGLAFTHVLTSPLVRAVETAQAVLPDLPAALLDALANQPVAAVLDHLRSLPPNAVVLLVGHEPQMSTLVETLLGMRHGYVQMKKAGLAWLEVDLSLWPREPALLLSLLTPAQLRALGA
ncbi:MAG: histidine phosphatase family protein [Armatimonadetes bacterium]|nr:histidine phosphatase family protein [Armatimonadota bacterium]